MKASMKTFGVGVAATMLLSSGPRAAQETGEGMAASGFAGPAAGHVPQVEIAWNRLYDYPEIYAHLDRLAAKWPDLLRYEVIGSSVENREMRVYILNNSKTGDDRSKPAMWVDGNVHGNEVQGGEAVVYLAWYLLENYASNERVAELVDRSAFYLMPMVNPDGRASWFNDAHTPHSSRSGVQPIDSDLDGAFDEDPPDDLNGDGHIVQMRKHVPGEGTHRLDPDDPRGDGRGCAQRRRAQGRLDLRRVRRPRQRRRRTRQRRRARRLRHEPPPGRRSGCPITSQFGAGPYPLYWPENALHRALPDRPSQRGGRAVVPQCRGNDPARVRERRCTAAIRAPTCRCTTRSGRMARRCCPSIATMVIWKDLYSVFGGFVTWTYEGLGIISFTNELWTNTRNSPDERVSFRDGRHWFDDHLMMGAGFVDWEPYEHPLYGAVEIGGFKKDVGRVPPSFLIEEMLHRNALFCVRHAEAMPLVVIAEPEITDLGNGVRAIDVMIENLHLIPTRSALAANKGIGRPDSLTLEGPGIEVLAGGERTDRFRPEEIELQEHQPERLVRDQGLGGREAIRVRWFVRGSGSAVVRYESEKARDAERSFDLQ